MMFTCFKCLKISLSLNELWNHLRYAHKINSKSNTRIVCGQSGCTQVYYHGKSYKRHLNKEHNNEHNNELDDNQPHQHAPPADLHLDDDDDDEEEEDLLPNDGIQELPDFTVLKEQITENVQEATCVYVTQMKGSIDRKSVV